MVEIPTGLCLSYIVNKSRVLFRKCVWEKVASQINNNSISEYDGLSALKRCNWNFVQNTQKFIQNPEDLMAPALVFHPFAVVMIWIHIEETENGEFSTDFVKECVRGGSIYGSIHETTHVVVQLFYSGLNTLKDKESTLDPESNHAVGIVLVDSKCHGYAYNLPVGPYKDLGVRCVELLMEGTLQKKFGKMEMMVPYSDRSKYANNLYAMFITCTCASKTATLETVDGMDGMDSSGMTHRADKIRPCKRTSRPSRIINNLMFLMSMVRPDTGVVLDEILLDEINTLDAFRRIVMDV
jgi:hypothetical protein